MTPTQLLIADDDRVILATLAEDLIAHGYAVQTATNGVEVTHLCEQAPPNLAILDIRMPIMNGIDAAQIIRDQYGVPTLFLSAYSDDELVERAVAEGALGYLVKPINSEKLMPAIAAALARARELQALTQTKHHLETGMQTKREIDIAVGVLIERFHLNRTESFEVLRRMARSSNRKLHEMARELIERGEMLALAKKIAIELQHGATP